MAPGLHWAQTAALPLPLLIAPTNAHYHPAHAHYSNRPCFLSPTPTADKDEGKGTGKDL